MRASKYVVDSESDPVRSRTVMFKDSTWSALQEESERRGLSISDILDEAYRARVIKLGPDSPARRRPRRHLKQAAK